MDNLRQTSHVLWLLDCWADIEQHVRQADFLFLGFDFDGTLAPIVNQPDKAVMDSGIATSLQALTGRRDVQIAILSGRSLEDLERRVHIENILLAGDHGFRVRNQDGSYSVPWEGREYGELADVHERLIRYTDGCSGVIIDRKEYSITVHYRNAIDSTGAELKSIVERSMRGLSFALSAGRMCWEIKPAVDWHKGKVFEWLIARAIPRDARIFRLYIGDDQTDEDVFAVLQEEGYPVLVRSSEKSGDTRARYYLNSTTEVGEFLSKLNRIL